MIVKFHPRGRGGGAGPVDYLLGKDRQRDGAIVLQGKPEEVRELIDASPYAKKYTSGVLSFAEQDLPPGQREKLMASFERVLMPGLDKDQYSVLWVEHRDKGRLELNFLVPNTELLTGRRLQPYYDRADRPRIDAWQTVVNGRLGLHDPNAPENRRALVTPSSLPKTKQEAAEAITRGLLALASSGSLKRVRTSLRRWKAQVLRSCAPQRAASALPTRTEGETSDLREPSMNSLLTLAKDLEQKSKAQQQSTGEMLKAAFSEHEKSVRAELSESGKRISAAIRAHEQGMSAAMQSNRLSVMRMVGRTWLTITMVSGLLFASLSGVLWYQGA